MASLDRRLWMAPELLRLPLASAPARGTQKGDVFSFGLVLYDIVGRNGPWGRMSDHPSYVDHAESRLFPTIVLAIAYSIHLPIVFYVCFFIKLDRIG